MGRRRQVQPEAARKLAGAAGQVRAAERKLAGEVLAAHDAGNSLRTMALATGLSHETVRGILGRERKRVAAARAQLEREPAVLSVTGREREEARRRQIARSLPVKNPDA